MLPLPRPSAVVNLTRAAVDHAVGSATTVAGLPARAFGVVDDIQALVRRVTDLVDRADALVGRAESIVDRTETAVGRVEGVADRASAAVGAAEGMLVRVDAVAGGAERAVRRVDEVIAATSAPIGEATRVAQVAGTVVAEAETVAGKAAAAMHRAERTLGIADDLLTAYEPALRRGAPMTLRFVEQLTADEVDAAIRLVDELPGLTEHLRNDILPILATLDRVGPDIHDLLNVTRDLNLAVAGIPGLRLLRRRGEGRIADNNHDDLPEPRQP